MLKLDVASILPYPTDARIWIEPALDCNGEECDRTWFDSDGQPLDLAPHFHLMESEPGAATVCYAIDGKLPPADAYETSHSR